MITAGIDAGSLTTKAVLLNMDRIMSHIVLPTGQNAAEAIQKAMDAVLEDAGISFKDVESIVCTGAGKKKVPIETGQATEVMCNARWVRHLYPKADGVIDIG
ncbi:MAG: BadF/BadG/BcrA/BcrD ATPase family protein, partial [Syntrophales bacterium]|nr:BadF/BadG/BcrA/BcrD ATPase family protein [Syntrophales bacterium]